MINDNNHVINSISGLDINGVEPSLDITVPKMSGAKKVAVLLLTVGTDKASEVLKKLPEHQIQKIGVEIANMRTISASDRRLILEDFVKLYKKQDYLIEGGMAYTKALMHETLGPQKGDKMIENIKYDSCNKPFISARNASAQQIIPCLMGESSQAIAIILYHIQPEKAGQVLSKLDKEIQMDVAFKIGTISKVSQSIINVVDVAFNKKLNATSNIDTNATSGVDSLISILNSVDGDTEKDILEFIESKNQLLSNKIKSSMFVFEDLVLIDAKGIQQIVKEINVKDIALALINASEEIKNTIFNNQSERATASLKEEMEMLGTPKNSKIVEAQQKIVHLVRRLEREGIIEISRGDEDA